MRRLNFGAGVLFAMLSFPVQAALDLDVSLALQYAAHIGDADPRSTVRGGQMNVKLEHDAGAFQVRGEGRLRWNDAYRNPIYSEQARDAYARSADWRELYVAGQVGSWNLSFGLQQVVWGKADNLRVVDQVNPVDLRDFILPELNDYRKPVLMVRGTRAVGDWQLEMLYLPRFTATSYAVPGSEFDLVQLDPELLASVQRLPDERPKTSLKNGEFGLQLSRTFGALDLSGFLFHTWDDNPAYRFLPASDAAGQPGLGLQSVYRRQFMAGLSLAHAMDNGLVLRSELAYVPNYSYMVGAGSDDGLTRSATLTALAGLDYVWRDWLLSAQVTDRYIDDWNASYLVPKHDPMYTLAATGTSLGGKLDSRLSLARFVDEGGYVAQVKSTWKPDDSWAYTAGVDVFGGVRTGIFGRFGDKDRLWFEMKYRF